MQYNDIDGSIVNGLVPEEGVNATLNITAATVVKSGPGRLMRVSVITAGSAVGKAYDTNATGSVDASNQIGTIPNTVGTYVFNWPCFDGITIVPGTSQVLAVSFA